MIDLRLLLITDRTVVERPLVEVVEEAIAGGVTSVMLREKDLATAALVELGRPIVACCRDRGAGFVVNHDAQAAAELGADGVHLGFRSVGVAGARAIVGGGAFVGRSTHDSRELHEALEDGADYVTFGPVFDTPSKRGLLEPRGLDGLAAAAEAAGTIPVVGLGGMDATTAAAARAAGAAGVACIRAVLAADDPGAAAAELRAAWERGA